MPPCGMSSRLRDARGNEPYIGSGQIGICRFDFCLSSSPRFVAHKLGLVADIHSRQPQMIAGISQIYKNTDDLCADLEQYFLEFEAFAEGDPDFFARVPGRDFCLSRNLSRKLSFISNPPRSRCGLRTS
jgi:hypothetical protein